MCSYCHLLTLAVLALNTRLLEHVNGKGINYLTNEIDKPVKDISSDDDFGYTEVYQYDSVLPNSDVNISDFHFPKHHVKPHNNFAIYAPPDPSNNLHSIVNPVIPSYENEPQYLTGLLADIFKANNINYVAIGIFLIKIVLFQKLLLIIAVYCITALHYALKDHSGHKSRSSSEEESRTFGARFDVYNICHGNWIHD